jgi:tRNA threonylcarbamoyladenosine modification (KEOPS) complex  Pcc1 subunit
MGLFNLVVQAGDDNEFVVTWRPTDADTVPDLVDATAEMKAVWTGSEAELSLTSAASDIAIDTEGGILTITLSAADTADLPAGPGGWYQLRVTDGDTLKTTVAYGKFTVLKSLLDA